MNKKISKTEKRRRVLSSIPNKAIGDYIIDCNQKGKFITYSDIVRLENEYTSFIKWFENIIRPFNSLKHNIYCYSVTLCDFEYDWETEIKSTQAIYGTGQNYALIFLKYIVDNLFHLFPSLRFDSENGMFCVYCDNLSVANELSYELATLYNKQEEKMWELIRWAKKYYRKKGTILVNIYESIKDLGVCDRLGLAGMFYDLDYLP